MPSVPTETVSPSAMPRSDFLEQARGVLNVLRLAVTAVLSDLGGISKPSDLQRALNLDKTLCWQIFKVGSSTEPLSSGSAVPSRTSLNRFLETAAGFEASTAKISQVWSAYEAFEKLVKVHAGDRVTFNSMVSAAAGTDDEWLAADLQHRRNIFRGISHAMGVQAKTRMSCTIVVPSRDGTMWDFGAVMGLVDLRILRPLPSVRVHGMELLGRQADAVRTPLSDGPISSLLEEFCSSPLPVMKATDNRTERGRWMEVELEWPQVGNVGTSTLMFGELLRDVPTCEGQSFNTVINRPFEMLFHDLLVAPGLFEGATPTAGCVWGTGRVAGRGNDASALEGNFAVEHLGRGPDALATPEVPHYPEMMRSVARKAGWDIEACYAIRVRVEFPIYQTTVGIRWLTPDPETPTRSAR